MPTIHFTKRSPESLYALACKTPGRTSVLKVYALPSKTYYAWSPAELEQNLINSLGLELVLEKKVVYNPSHLRLVPSKESEGDLRITEGVAGLWHYHLSTPQNPHQGLCGARVMTTLKPVSSWKDSRKPSHLPKAPTWCEACDELRELVTSL